jgi:hypothetical protein
MGSLPPGFCNHIGGSESCGIPMPVRALPNHGYSDVPSITEMVFQLRDDSFRHRSSVQPGRCVMNKVVLHLFILVLFVVSAAIVAHAQSYSYITVHGRELNADLMVMNITQEGNAYQLTCEQGAAWCSSLRKGRYQMVELPKYFGMYDCRDIEVYPQFAKDPQKHRKLGEYCIKEREF